MKAISSSVGNGGGDDKKKGMTQAEMDAKRKDPKFVEAQRQGAVNRKADEDARKELEKRKQIPTKENIAGMRASKEKTGSYRSPGGSFTYKK